MSDTQPNLLFDKLSKMSEEAKSFYDAFIPRIPEFGTQGRDGQIQLLVEAAEVPEHFALMPEWLKSGIADYIAHAEQNTAAGLKAKLQMMTTVTLIRLQVPHLKMQDEVETGPETYTIKAFSAS